MERAMSDASPTVWPLETNSLAILADCHIHTGGPQFPKALLDKLGGVGLIVTLGDMGETAGLDQLAAIAPVVGVRGADDSDDPRTDRPLLVLESEHYAIGCVFDAVAAGLATSSDPFEAVPDFAAAAEKLFGRQIHALLCASTHRGALAHADGIPILNPGSAVLPADGDRQSFARLQGEAGFNLLVERVS
jgi:predicted phosphodiesterase